MHRLRPFIYNATCELCDNTQYKYNRGIIMAKKCFVVHEEVINVFHEKIYTPTIEKVSFHLDRVRIIGSVEFGKTKNGYSHDRTSKDIYEVKDILCRKC